MDLQQLRNVVEVAQCGSISKAARKLYMGQPNLSKSLRELEQELGCPLFQRTAQGVAPTPAGAEFLASARSILEQVDLLSSRYHPRTEQLSLSVCGPRSSYLASAFCGWMQTNASGSFRLQFRETTPTEVLSAVASDQAQAGVLRYQVQSEDYYENLVVEKGLYQAPLWEFSLAAVFHRNHPLAPLKEVTLPLLSECTRIVQGDMSPTLADVSGPNGGEIVVFDRAGQFDVLRSASGSFLWSCPLPPDVLTREELVQRPCRDAPRCRDTFLWKGKLSPEASSLLDAVRLEIDHLVQSG